MKKTARKFLTLLLCANLFLSACASSRVPPQDPYATQTAQAQYPREERNDEWLANFATSPMMPVVLAAGFVAAVGIGFWGIRQLGE
jgi:outer membrane biogenesis lipoprotein LolB